MNPRFGITAQYWEKIKNPDWPNFETLVDIDLNNLDKTYKENVINKHFISPSYHPSMNQIARHRLAILDNINASYSQAMQDIFILTFLNGKSNGTYLELGASVPIHFNNTYLLSKVGWTGVSIDNEEILIPGWKKDRPRSSFICQDAFSIDYKELFNQHNLPDQIDFLQIDVDHHNQHNLLNLLFSTGHRFSLIMYETDLYYKGRIEKEKAEEILIKHNYKRLVENIVIKDLSLGQHVPFEDWWIDSDYINTDIQEKFLTLNLEKVYPFELFCMTDSVDHLMKKVLLQDARVGYD
jgi:hypothetical protein